VPSGQGVGRISVQSAIYGPNCRVFHNVTAHLASACNSGNGQRCEYRIDHRVIGDPTVGCAKDYVYRWSCVGGDDRDVHESVVYREASGKTAILTCPVASSADRGIQGGWK
jgi:hypothetical protein